MNPRLAQTEGILSDLVAFQSVSSASNLDIIAYLAERLDAVGARVEVLPTQGTEKANLWATIGPEAPGGLVLSGHTDVVPTQGQAWRTDPFDLTHQDDRLFGRGTCDMKGFLAACVATAPLFQAANLQKPIHFAFTHDEEIGCLGALALVEALRGHRIQPAMAIVGEPTQMRLIDGHKGCYEYAVHFKGRAGHGSDPFSGVNAAEYAARFGAGLVALRGTLTDRTPPDSPFEPPSSTLSVGRIEGGFAPNVIAETATVEWEMRPVNAADKALVEAEVAQLTAGLQAQMQAVDPEAAITTEILGAVDGFHRTQSNPARDMLADLTHANGADVVSFCTEAGIFQSLGLSVIICGPGSIEQAHKADEFITRDQLVACLDLLERLPGHLNR